MKERKINFSTKAQTLQKLSHLSIGRYIKPLIYFKVEDWKKNPKKFIEKIKSIDQGSNFIVRSSSLNEDLSTSSNAGVYDSVLNVKLDVIHKAIEKVISSYSKNKNKDEVLIQPMLENVTKSGVAFSHDQNTGSPYRVINWHEGNDTSFITSGMGGNLWIEPSKILNKKLENSEFKTLRIVLTKLMDIFENKPIDCEFAYTISKNQEKFWLLQVRPLILKSQPESFQDQYKRTYSIWDSLRRGMNKHPFLLGNKTIYGVMPDWNPAEIIGLRPRPLALSLYKELVTDNIWAYQRDNYGYKNLRSFPLIKHFYGLPYVDVRVSFNSFVPANINDNLSEKLVNYYLSLLEKKDYLHDKIEFDIVFSCYTLDLNARLSNLKKYGFSKNEQNKISKSLLDLTNNILNPTNGLWVKDYKKLKVLEERRIRIKKSKQGLISKIYWLLEDAKRYGTLPFAGLARAAFISVQMLKSFVNVGLFTMNDYNNFMQSVSTVSKQLSKDLQKLNKSKILKKYGHLRPGTYDIKSPRYDENPNLFFNWKKNHKKNTKLIKFKLTKNKKEKLEKILVDIGLNFNSSELLNVIKTTIELREFAKFEFTKNLSDALVLLEELGEKFKFDRDDMSFCDINIVRELHSGTASTMKLIEDNIGQGKKKYEDTKKILMPPLIFKPDQVWGFQSPDYHPNYVTQKKITAKVTNSNNTKNFNNLIVCIPNADPGFDWLFSYRIGGIITAWGGANSHMSIRASELQIPAVIGVGENKYKILSNAKILHIDCANQIVKVID